MEGDAKLFMKFIKDYQEVVEAIIINDLLDDAEIN